MLGPIAAAVVRDANAMCSSCRASRSGAARRPNHSQSTSEAGLRSIWWGRNPAWLPVQI